MKHLRFFDPDEVESLRARVAELEAREKQRADDDAWADGMGGIRIRIDGAKWNIQYHDCRPFGGSFEAFSTTIGGAIRALREKMEARPAKTAKPCQYCLRVECECSDFDVAPDMGDK